MKCPKCGTEENIKWFLRHQQENEKDESDNANVITILCTDCGYNQSFFLSDCLNIIFPDWEPSNINFNELAGLFREEPLQNNFNLTNIEEENFEDIEKEKVESENTDA